MFPLTPLLPVALMGGEIALANAGVLRSNSHQFAVVDEFDSGFQRKLNGRCQVDRTVFTKYWNVGRLGSRPPRRISSR